MQIYQASNQFRSKQIGATLSKQLRKKYGRRSIRILKGDVVKIVRGEYKGVEGKVTKISIEKNSVSVEGVQKEKAKGGKVDILIHCSNGIITSLKTDDKWRVKILEHKPSRFKKQPYKTSANHSSPLTSGFSELTILLCFSPQAFVGIE